MNEIKVEYPSGSKLDARVYDPNDSRYVWNVDTKVFDLIDPLNLPSFVNYIVPLADTGTGMYQGDFPLIGPPFNRYPILISERTNLVIPAWTDKEIGSGFIEWDGYQEASAVVITITSYSTVQQANAYFATQLYTSEWDNSNDEKRQKALNKASQIIDQFRYRGTKTNDLQIHEFPRSGLISVDYTTVPTDILYAQYEIALALLKGWDPERLMMGRNVTSRGFGAVRTTYDPSRTPEWLENGVPSMTAWGYLLPYLLRDSEGGIKLHRVS